MGSITPNPKKRGYLLPTGCKDLVDVLHNRPPSPAVHVNGKIRAMEVRVIGVHGLNLGIMPISEALALAQSLGIDLVEIAPNAKPPICQIVDYSKFRYEASRRRKSHT